MAMWSLNADTKGLVWKTKGTFVTITEYLLPKAEGHTRSKSNAGLFDYAVYVSVYEELGYSFSAIEDIEAGEDTTPPENFHF